MTGQGKLSSGMSCGHQKAVLPSVPETGQFLMRSLWDVEKVSDVAIENVSKKILKSVVVGVPDFYI